MINKFLGFVSRRKFRNVFPST